MLKNHNAKKIYIFGLAGLIGLCGVVFLDSQNMGNVPAYQAQQLKHETSLSGQKPFTKLESNQSNIVLDRKEEIVSGKAMIGYRQCSLACESTLSMLDEGLELSDETFQNLEPHIKEIAAYLQNDEQKRQFYLQMALTTPDGDKRAFLSAMFKRLPFDQKVELGESFVGSDNWRVRADGVALIADDSTPSLGMANKLMEIFSREQHSYLKSNILNKLARSPELKGNTEILNQLDSAIYNETNPSVRVTALKAKMQLSEQPHHILPDAFQALRTNETEFQLAGLFALEQVLEYDKRNIESGIYIDRNTIKNEFQIIRNLAVYGHDRKRFDRLINQADKLYSRHFE